MAAARRAVPIPMKNITSHLLNHLSVTHFYNIQLDDRHTGHSGFVKTSITLVRIHRVHRFSLIETKIFVTKNKIKKIFSY